MFEYVAALVGMQQVDEVLLAKAQAKENTQVQIVQTTSPNFSLICSTKENKKMRECLDAKFRLSDKTPDPYADMWDPNWINRP